MTTPNGTLKLLGFKDSVLGHLFPPLGKPTLNLYRKYLPHEGKYGLPAVVEAELRARRQLWRAELWGLGGGEGGALGKHRGRGGAAGASSFGNSAVVGAELQGQCCGGGRASGTAVVGVERRGQSPQHCKDTWAEPSHFCPLKALAPPSTNGNCAGQDLRRALLRSGKRLPHPAHFHSGLSHHWFSKTGSRCSCGFPSTQSVSTPNLLGLLLQGPASRSARWRGHR